MINDFRTVAERLREHARAVATTRAWRRDGGRVWHPSMIPHLAGRRLRPAPLQGPAAVGCDLSGHRLRRRSIASCTSEMSACFVAARDRASV